MQVPNKKHSINQPAGWVLRLLPQNEKELIERHFNFYEKLRLGIYQPHTEAQRRFLDVLTGKRRPTTDHEHAYTNYRQSIIAETKRKNSQEENRIAANRPHDIHSAVDKLRQSRHKIPGHSSETGKRYIDEPLGTREDYKRDRGRISGEAAKYKL